MLTQATRRLALPNLGILVDFWAMQDTSSTNSLVFLPNRAKYTALALPKAAVFLYSCADFFNAKTLNY